MQLDFYWSHDYAIQSTSANGSTGESILAFRSQSEGALYSYSLGVRGGFTLPSGMGLKSGINYSRINRSFSYEQTDGMGMINDSIPGVVASSTNSYSYVDIPLLFSYEMNGYGPFYYALNVGPIFNMTLSTEGTFFDAEGNIVPFEDGAPGALRAYKKTAGLSFFASFGFHYVMSDIIDFVVEPNIRLGVGSITDNGYAIDESYSSVGLITGFRYKF